ncbi:MAG: hypothetical protein JNJ53_14995 [Rhizobiales bacterium]|nr:hypothetical protein [Hyphomicrobiales bacterium]
MRDETVTDHGVPPDNGAVIYARSEHAEMSGLGPIEQADFLPRSCEDVTMTKLLQNAFDAANALPDDRQDEIGEIILAAIEQERSALRLSREQIAEVQKRRRGPDDFAADAEVEAFFRRFVG